MASTTPTTPIARRSSSQPVHRPSSGSESQIEVLYQHPSARIISFTTSPKPTSGLGSSNGRPRVEEEPEALSWVSRSERIIAVGPLSIYRAPGSVAFLNCSQALRPILLKSQCWEVDGSGKFVLQIRPPQYWRIEVPNKSNEEKSRVEELKAVLAKVLLFERTPCPFQRDFTVELPEPPLTPVKKRPWKPVERPKLVIDPIPNHREDNKFSIQRPLKEPSVSSTPTSELVTAYSPAPSDDINPATAISRSLVRPSVSSDNVPEQEDGSGISTRGDSEPREGPIMPSELSEFVTVDEINPAGIMLPLSSESSDPIVVSQTGFAEVGDSFNDSTGDTNIIARSDLQPFAQSTTNEREIGSRPQALQDCSRSITAHPVLSLVTSPPSKQRSRSPMRSNKKDDLDSNFSSSVESFHSVQSWHSPLASPSPLTSDISSSTLTYPYPHDNIVLSKRRVRNSSEIQSTTDTPHLWETTSTDSESMPRCLTPPPETPTLVNDANEKSDEEQFEAITPPTVRSSVNHRALTSSSSRRRGLSPLPPAANLFSPPRQSARGLQTAKHLPTAIIQKTCEILLSPPSHLLHLMLNIASKIAAGEWRGVLPGYAEAVHWDFEDEYGGNEWTEDDYGISLFNTQNKPQKESSNYQGGSWDVD